MTDLLWPIILAANAAIIITLGHNFRLENLQRPKRRHKPARRTHHKNKRQSSSRRLLDKLHIHAFDTALDNIR
jgi:hypothetical protein